MVGTTVNNYEESDRDNIFQALHMKEYHLPEHSDSGVEYDKAEIQVHSLSWESEKLRSIKEQLDQYYLQSVSDNALQMRLPKKHVAGAQTRTPSQSNKGCYRTTVQ